MSAVTNVYRNSLTSLDFFSLHTWLVAHAVSVTRDNKSRAQKHTTQKRCSCKGNYVARSIPGSARMIMCGAVSWRQSHFSGRRVRGINKDTSQCLETLLRLTYVVLPLMAKSVSSTQPSKRLTCQKQVCRYLPRQYMGEGRSTVVKESSCNRMSSLSDCLHTGCSAHGSSKTRRCQVGAKSMFSVSLPPLKVATRIFAATVG
eukprot:4023598-Pleurochrysis_carterae.AAC.3